MDRLKTIEEIVTPDARHTAFVILTPSGPMPRSLEYLHKAISSTSLHDGVPEEVRRHFLQAQHLAIYAWFYYPFNVTADFMSIVSIEYALKVRSGKKRMMLKNLINLAIREGWVRDEGFSNVRPRREAEKAYVEELAECLPGLRNSYAHGSSDLFGGAYQALKVASEFINQLFPAEAANNSLQGRRP